MSVVEDLKYQIFAQVVGTAAVKELNAQVTSLVDIGKGLAGAYGAKQFVGFLSGIIDTAANLELLSEKTGVAVSDLSKFQVIAEQAGLPIETFAQRLGRLSRALVGAATGNKTFQEAFSNQAQIKITDTSGKLLPLSTVMTSLAQRFQTLGGSSEKAALSISLFGRGGLEMIPFLNQLAQSSDRVGLSISENFAESSLRFNQSLGAMKVAVKNSMIDGLEPVMPQLQSFSDALGQNLTHIEGVTEVMQGLTDAIGVLALAVQPMVELFAQGLDANLTAFTAFVQAIIDGIKIVATAFDALQRFREAKTVGEGWKAFKDTIKDIPKQWDEALDNMKDSVNKFADRSKNRLKGSLNFSDAILNPPIPEPKDKGKGRVPEENSGVLGDAIKKFEEKIAKIKAEAAAYGQSNAVKQQAIFLVEVEAAGIGRSTAAYARLKKGITEATNALELKKELEKAAELERKGEGDFRVEQLKLDNIGLTNSELQKQILIYETANQVAEQTRLFTKAGAQAYRDAAEAIRDKKIEMIDDQERQKEFWTTGATQALKKYLDTAKDVAAQMEQIFSHAFQNLEDSLVNFVKTGRMEWHKFIDDLITDLIRFEVKKAMAGIIQGSGIASLIGYNAPGAGATSGFTGPANAGDYHLITPLEAPVAGKTMLAQTSASAQKAKLEPDWSNVYPFPSGSGGSVSHESNVSVTVNMQTGGDTVESDSKKAQLLGKTITNAVKMELVNQKRPGGLLS